MNPGAEVDRLLAECGAKLKRSKGHQVWELPNGNNFTRACTPSDIRADHNNLANLKHALGITPEHREGERRERKPKRAPTPAKWRASPAVNSQLAEALLTSGVAEKSLRETVNNLEARVETLLAQSQKCWMCRLRKWWRRLCV